ncbi:protein NO VEIN domain-containing protein [Bacillus cereus]|uniref:DUF3883 domain-containing protein n=1 Tax=Bacillus cereus TaxID=1396 RepID=UPI002AC19525|nr:DUF3883 domain-containing protein [Bacillus cereus]MDZ4478285.1 DUF3883 domain-containing protein [Bacillus cereus]MDZ4494591.1 DUF3883 domain-containing protein [Bacillus cereus]MDZ4517276.1 DUF3883 domain-containing protein [Bacillus cereus]
MIMLTDIKQHKSYMNINDMRTILVFIKNNFCERNQIKNYFNTNLRIVKDIDDTLSLFQCIGIINSTKDNKIVIEGNFNDKNLRFHIIKLVFLYLKKNKITIFNINSTNYSLFISHYYYAIRNFLLISSVIEPLNNNTYTINIEFMPLAESIFNKTISLDEFKKSLAAKEALGTKAELFVIDYERKKLPNKNIEHISPIDVAAGYDIKSYTHVDAPIYNKFIEVKCITERERFFWSKNEIEVAKLLGDNYFLYLVDSSFNSHPLEIKNPYKTLYLNNKLNYIEESISFDVNEIKEHPIS